MSYPNIRSKLSTTARPFSRLLSCSVWSGENKKATIARPTLSCESQSKSGNVVLVSKRNLLISCCVPSTSPPSSPTTIATTRRRSSVRPLGASMTLARTNCSTVSSSMRPTPESIESASRSGRIVNNSHFTAANRAATSCAPLLTTTSRRGPTHSRSRKSFCATVAATSAFGVAPFPVPSKRCVKPNSIARSGGKHRNNRKVSTPKAASCRNTSGLISNAVRQDSENCAQSISRRCKQ
mmetsp:Transcript_152490/g.284085  ORF Transcript_152490/g.284085 Transcript_152490/m.284085 type:complete len:238 (-) Transcript_152490:216-929(-)